MHFFGKHDNDDDDDDDDDGIDGVYGVALHQHCNYILAHISIRTAMMMILTALLVILMMLMRVGYTTALYLQQAYALYKHTETIQPPTLAYPPYLYSQPD